MSRFKRDVVVNINDDRTGHVHYLQLQQAIGKFAMWHGDKFKYVHVSDDMESVEGSLIGYFKVEINPAKQADYILRAEYIKAKGTYRYYT